MKLLAQQGWSTGDKIQEGLKHGFIDGAIYGPQHTSLERLGGLLSENVINSPSSDRLFDPQYYACFKAQEGASRLGQLAKGEYKYFGPRRRSDLERERNVRDDISKCLEFQRSLAVSAFISPNIVIRKSLASGEATIAKNFIRNTAEIHAELGDPRPVFATLAISDVALLNRSELLEFLNEITLLDSPPHGFYFLVESSESVIAPTLIEGEILAAWMLINHSLKLNGYQVVNGYSDMLSPFIGAAGAYACATGWFNTLKVFSLQKFEPSEGIQRTPIARYLSARLLNSIRYTELHQLRRRFPDILNNLSSDEYYPEEEGSKPDQRGEALQNWQAIKNLCRNLVSKDLRQSLAACEKAIGGARDSYSEITALGFALRERSNHEHLESLMSGIASFRRLAEL